MFRSLLAALLLTLAVGCSTAAPGNATDAEPTGSASGQRFPDVVDVTVERAGDTYSFAVTLSSPYDTPARYADAWRIRSADGTVFGVNELTHDHATEQPFTRTLSGVAIPAGTAEVVVEGRDKANGWGGATMTVALPT